MNNFLSFLSWLGVIAMVAGYCFSVGFFFKESLRGHANRIKRVAAATVLSFIEGICVYYVLFVVDKFGMLAVVTGIFSFALLAFSFIFWLLQVIFNE